MIRRSSGWGLLFLSFTGLSSCTSAAPGVSVPAPEQYYSDQCYVSDQPADIWMQSAEEWATLPAKTREEFSQGSTLDWSRNNILLISDGYRSTAGYGISLSNWLLEGAHWQVTRLNRAPAAGEVTAQVITSPCLLVVLPSQVRSLTVLNESGQELGRWPY